jgi:chromate transporter
LLKNRHIPFLKAVFIYSLTAFGGPQGHLGMMQKVFVDKRNDISAKQLLDLNAFCQLLPGASSTQIITLIGYNRGGFSLALITLLIWIFPACFFMGVLSFFADETFGGISTQSLFRFIQPMAIGFLTYAAVRAFRSTIKSKADRIILFFALLVCSLFFKTPWIFPLVIILGGITSILTANRERIQDNYLPRKIKWGNIYLFLGIFLVSGFLSEMSRKQEWQNRKPYNLFENSYRFGSIVFGGGDVLISLMYEQYVARPTSKRVKEKNQNVLRIDRDDFLTGAGIVRGIPGPVFSIASYTGGLVMRKEGKLMQVFGAILSTVAIFLPSFLLVVFFYPVWNNLHKHEIVHRALRGINASVVGIMISSVLYLTKDSSVIGSTEAQTHSLLTIGIITGTFLLLVYSKLPTPFIVLICLLLGWFF